MDQSRVHVGYHRRQRPGRFVADFHLGVVDGQPANGTPQPPPGRAANAAPNSIAPQIQTISELRALRAKNPDGYKAWIQDPGNDIGKLANR